MRRLGICGLVLLVAAVSSASLAFEEQKLPPGKAAPSDAGSSPGSSAALSDSSVVVPRIDSGTKIRVPGLGVIGEIPKMDFGLELLYGAQQPKGLEMDRNEANGVMGRVTVPIKPSR